MLIPNIPGTTLTDERFHLKSKMAANMSAIQFKLYKFAHNWSIITCNTTFSTEFDTRNPFLMLIL